MEDSDRLEGEPVRKSLQCLRDEFVELTNAWDPRDVIAHLWWVHCLRRPGHDDSFPAAVEIAAALLVQARMPDEPSRQRGNPGVLIEQWSECVHAISLNGFFETLEDKRGAQDDARFSFALYSSVVRFPTYAVLEASRLERMLASAGPLEDALLRDFAFSVRDAVAIWHYVAHEAIRRVNERHDLIRAEKKRLASLPKKEERESNVAVAMALEAGFAKLGDVLCFEAEAIARGTGLASHAVLRCLEEFSIPLGHSDVLDIVGATNSLRRRPFLGLGNGSFLVTIPNNFLFSIETFAREAFRKDQRISQTYFRRRARYLESEATSLLAKAFGSTNQWTNVQYGPPADIHEVDGVVVADSVLVLIQAKSGVFTDPALRGAEKRFERDAKKNIIEAVEQLHHVMNVLENVGTLEGRTPSRDKIVLRYSDFTRVIPIVVTMEDLGPLGATVWALEGASQLGRPAPFVVYLCDLEVIAEFTEWPALLVTYLERRARLNVRRDVKSSDELDMFEHYLLVGLHFEEEFPLLDGSLMYIGDMAHGIEDYYEWRAGFRKKEPPKVGRRLPPEIARLVTDVSASKMPGRIEIAATILGMDGRALRKLDEMFRKLRRLTAKDKGIHNATFAMKEGPGLTIVSAPPSMRIHAEDVLHQLCTKHLMQRQTAIWCGFGWIQRTGTMCDFVELVRRP